MRTEYATQTGQTGETGRSGLARREGGIPVAQRLLVRPDEAAALLGVGRSTVYVLLRRGELPVVHVGRAARIPMAAIARFVERQTSPTAP